jgi:hypothetical protein
LFLSYGSTNRVKYDSQTANPSKDNNQKTGGPQ